MIYIYVFVSSTLFAWLAERSKDRAVIILCSAMSILIPSILGGIRTGHMGGDTGGYGYADAWAARAASSWLEYAFGGHEQGYKTVVFLVMRIFYHQNWAIFAYQLITNTCVYIGAYKHKHLAPLHYIILVYLITTYISTFGFIRQYMAASIIFLGIDTLEKQQYGKFLLYVIVATLFHSSAPIALFALMGVFIISSEKYSGNKNFRNVMILVSLFATFSAGHIIRYITFAMPVFEKYEGYTANIANAGFSGLSGRLRAGMMYIVELAMAYLYSQGSKKTFAKIGDAELIQFYKANLYFLLLYENFVQFFTVRIIIYSRIVNILLLAALPGFVKEKHLKFIVAVGVIISISINFYIHTRSDDVYPFRSVIDNMYLY